MIALQRVQKRFTAKNEHSANFLKIIITFYDQLFRSTDFTRRIIYMSSSVPDYKIEVHPWPVDETDVAVLGVWHGRRHLDIGQVVGQQDILVDLRNPIHLKHHKIRKYIVMVSRWILNNKFRLIYFETLLKTITTFSSVYCRTTTPVGWWMLQSYSLNCCFRGHFVSLI